MSGYGFLSKKSNVWFCLECEDEAPWLNTDKVKCPNCYSTDHVVTAQRFQNLTSRGDDND